MNIAELQNALRANLKVILDICVGVSDQQMRFKPAKDRWSLLEVINHLADEEREDFRTCLSNMIKDPAIDWPDNHPFDWVESREYGKRDLSVLHAGRRKFEEEIRTGDVIASWVAHDYFHIRQITNLKWEYLMKSARPYSCAYAGEY